MAKALTYEQIRDYMSGEEGNGCKLITSKMEFAEEKIKQNKSNTLIKVRITCKCTNEFITNYENFKRGDKRQCSICGRSYSATKYEDIESFINSHNKCLLITTKEEFDYKHLKRGEQPNNIELDIKCGCKDEYIFKTSFYSFKYRNKQHCNICGHKIVSDSQRFTYDYIKSYIEIESNSGCKLISENYIGCKEDLSIQCSCGKEFKTSFDEFKNAGTRRCSECYNKATGDGNRIWSIKKINMWFDNNLNGYSCTSSNFINSQQNLNITCDKGHSFPMSWNSIYSANHRCPICSLVNRSGKKHPNWKGGISPLHEYLRHNISEWKTESLQFTNFKCCLTSLNKTELVIHHLIPFIDIVREVLIDLNFELKSHFAEYLKEDLRDIALNCKRSHNKNGLGIVLDSKIHKLFHHTYGVRNNTPSQFLEFVHRLESHEFDTYLKENNLTLNINYEILENLLNQNDLSYKAI